MHPHVDIGDFLQATIALIAIANPFAALPVFLSLVPATRRRRNAQAANRVSLAVFLILAGAVLVDRFVLQLFGISFPAFRAGGGLVVTLTGLDMLRREHPTRSGDDVTTALSAADQLIVPVAMPLIAGPGTIIAAMTLAARARPGPPVMVLIAVAVTALAVWLVLAMSGWMQQRLGARGQAIVVRFMGLVLVAIGAELVLGGIGAFFGLGAAASR